MFLYGIGAGLPLLAIAKGARFAGDRLTSPVTRRVMNAVLGGMLIVAGLILIKSS